jgi:predicted nucleic acid-binding protein
VTTYFADTFYFFALLNPSDKAHAAAVRWASKPGGPLITTYWVLTEVADAMSAPENRQSALTLISGLRRNPAVEILPPVLELFDRGLDLYAQRADKSWSLTDCISFAVMSERGLSEALIGDHHFEQAEFRAMLKAE